jgi:hypothetical protein
MDPSSATPTPEQNPSETDSLENPDSTTQTSSADTSSSDTNTSSSDTSTSAVSSPPPEGQNQPPTNQPKGPSLIKRFLRRVNIYFLLFLLLILIALVVVAVAYFYGKQSNGSETKINSQTLSQKDLENLANGDSTIGDANSVLNIRSNAVFGGKVLIRDSLEVAGGLQVGGSLTLQGLTVSGDSKFSQVEIGKGLSVNGNTGINGQLAVQSGLSVNGGGTFKGPVSTPQITTSSLQLNGALTVMHHITAGGPLPSGSRGSAVGGGGSASVNGSDTAGSISIGTGSSPAAGCFITVRFAQNFNSTPHVVITPVGSTAGSLKYYVNRSPSNFSVCTASPAPGGRSFGFDYIVFD